MPARRRGAQRPGKKAPEAPEAAAATAAPDATPWLEARGADLLLRVRVQPRASPEGLAGVLGSRLRVRVSAPPVEGAANARLVQLLAGLLGLPPGTVTVTRGAKGRDKDLLLQGAAAQRAELAARLCG